LGRDWKRRQQHERDRIRHVHRIPCGPMIEYFCPDGFSAAVPAWEDGNEVEEVDRTSWRELPGDARLPRASLRSRLWADLLSMVITSSSNSSSSSSVGDD
jgi:hypothetical protein